MTTRAPEVLKINHNQITCRLRGHQSIRRTCSHSWSWGRIIRKGSIGWKVNNWLVVLIERGNDHIVERFRHWQIKNICETLLGAGVSLTSFPTFCCPGYSWGQFEVRTSVGRKANQTGHAENLTSHQQNEAHKGPIEKKFVGKNIALQKKLKR